MRHEFICPIEDKPWCENGIFIEAILENIENAT